MTREKLFEELIKINGITVVQYDTCKPLAYIEILYKNSLILCYYSNNVLSVLGAYFKNRSEQQVLAVVKALVE